MESGSTNGAPTPPDSSREAILAALRALLDGLSEPVSIRIISVRKGKRLAAFRVEPRPAEAPAKPRPDDERDCHADIQAVLTEAGRRLTGDQIKSDLQSHGWHHGDRTVDGYLAAMVKAGVLDSDPRARPPGYRPSAK